MPTNNESNTAAFATPTVHCGSCMATIAEALEPLPGVLATEPVLDSKTVQVAYDPAVTDAGRIAAAIRDAGYEVTDITT